MRKSQILVITQIDDPHTDDVITTLGEFGHNPVRLNTDDIPLNILVSMELKNKAFDWRATLDILTNGRSISSDAVRSVWWRRPSEFAIPQDLTLQERIFLTEEIDHALCGLWFSLDCYWVSHPEFIRQASWKGEQLIRAQRYGFDVPRTIISSDPDVVRKFYKECNEKVVFKVMSDPHLGAPKLFERDPSVVPDLRTTSTTLLTDAELEILETVRLAPCMFQEHVPKKFEYRVTVIGEEVFVAEIHSQKNEQTKIDWRGFDSNIPIFKGTLPDHVVQACLSLVKSYNLNYSAIDLILTPDDRYVFLENNPNGQFRFIELLEPELKMTEALATCLVQGGNAAV